MTEQQAQAVLDKIIGQVFGFKNPLTLDQFMQKYTFDIRLPQQVYDSESGEETWTQSINPTKCISKEAAWAHKDWEDMPKQPINSIQDILTAWNKVNYTATNRHIDSINVSKSDGVYSAENIYYSIECGRSKNILFSDGVFDSEYIAAGQRSLTSSYCMRMEDSDECANSFSVTWSQKIVNSFFIQGCGDMYECMFCSHIKNKKFCIANMQFEEEEYRKIKDMVARWILTS